MESSNKPTKPRRSYLRVRSRVHPLVVGYSAELMTDDGPITTSVVVALLERVNDDRPIIETENSIYVPM